jgi:hypothetical protein
MTDAENVTISLMTVALVSLLLMSVGTRNLNDTKY